MAKAIAAGYRLDDSETGYPSIAPPKTKYEGEHSARVDALARKYHRCLPALEGKNPYTSHDELSGERKSCKTLRSDSGSRKERPTPAPAPTPTPTETETETETPTPAGSSSSSKSSSSSRDSATSRAVSPTPVPVSVPPACPEKYVGEYIRDRDLGSTYKIVQRDGCSYRQWIAPGNPLVYSILWDDILENYNHPVGTVLSIPLDTLQPWHEDNPSTHMLVRRFDGTDERIFVHTTKGWEHVPDIVTFNANGYRWENVVAADANFWEGITR